MANEKDDRIAKLEADAAESDAHIARLHAEAAAREEHIAALDAAALLRDRRIAELVAHIDGVLDAQEHRAVIERAKGVIMSTMHCSPDAAFAVLVAQSQNENRKLRDVAAELAGLQERP